MKSILFFLVSACSLCQAAAESGYQRPRQNTHASIDARKRPVIGVLTEPMRGNLLQGDSQHQDGTYVPKTHVQFLEQAGVRVVPIDYRLSTAERTAIYNQVNGVYMPGDSHMGVVSDEYKLAFTDTLSFQERQMNEFEQHFPVFLMGNSLQNLVRAYQTGGGHLTNIKEMQYESFELTLREEPENTYLLSAMTPKERDAVFNIALFFNKEVSGLTLEKLRREQSLSKNFKALATFKTPDSDVVAILEGTKLPIYAFTYAVEMIQFYFENSTDNLDEDVLDHSIIARTHAQYFARTIADEARMNNNTFAGDVFESLVRHKKLASVTYFTDRADRQSALPAGMTRHDVYLV